MEKKEMSIAERIAIMKEKSEAGKLRSAEIAANAKAFIEEGKRQFDQLDRDMYDIARGKKPKEEPSAVPGLQEKIAATRARMQRSDELIASQRKLLDEMAAEPLEQECDEVFAQVGQQLYAAEQEELQDAEAEAKLLEEAERREQEEDDLLRRGQPPPLRPVK